MSEIFPPLKTMQWLVEHFHDRARDDPDDRTKQDYQEVRAARDAVYDSLHWLKAMTNRMSQQDDLSETEKTEIELAFRAIKVAEGLNLTQQTTAPFTPRRGGRGMSKATFTVEEDMQFTEICPITIFRDEELILAVVGELGPGEGATDKDRAFAEEVRSALAAHDDLLALAKDVLAGASISGRWLDSSGTAIDGETREEDPPETEDGEPPTWEPYTEEETAAWLEGIAADARDAIAKAEGLADV